MSSDDGERAPWSAADSDPPEHRCGFELLPADVDREEGYDELEAWRTDWGSASCCRWVWEDGRCRWHADADPNVLRKAVEEREERVQNLDGVVLRDVELDDGVSFAGCRLRGATFDNVSMDDNVTRSSPNLADSDLRGAIFLNVDLRCADLSDADLRDAEFCESNLEKAKFTNTKIKKVYFSNTKLEKTNFLNSNIIEVEFSDVNLRWAEFSDATLRETYLHLADIRYIRVNRATTIEELSEPSPPSPLDAIRSFVPLVDDPAAEAEEDDTTEDEDDSNPLDWDQMARVYHDLKLAFDENGFVGRAREFHIDERRARRHETAEEEGWFSRRHLTALVSGAFTVYGVGVTRLIVTMLVLFTVSTVIYAAAGIEAPLTYSAITFTTSPPRPTTSLHPLVRFVADVETFFGTLLIVSFGFVLGNREQF